MISTRVSQSQKSYRKKKKGGGSILQLSMSKITGRLNFYSGLSDEKKKEITGVLLVGFAVFLFFSLVSYDRNDLPFFSTDATGTIHNYAGVVGARLAGAVFSIAGYLSFSFPLLFAFFGLILILEKQKTVPAVKYVFISFLLLFSSSFISMISMDNLSYAPGGVIGDFIAGITTKYIGTVGAYVLDITMIFVAVMVVFEISFKKFAEGLVAFSKVIMAITAKGAASCWAFALKELERLGEVKEKIKERKPAAPAEKLSKVKINDNVNGFKGAALKDPFPAKKDAGAEKPASETPVKPVVINEHDSVREHFPLVKASSVPVPSGAVSVKEQIRVPAAKDKQGLNEVVAAREAEKMERQELKYEFPSLDILETPAKIISTENETDLMAHSQRLEETLRDFKIDAKVTEINKGPVITTYELQPAPGVKVSKIVTLSDDIALALAAQSIRIVAPIPGKAAVGIEVPNRISSVVYFKDVLTSYRAGAQKKMNLPLFLGKKITGEPLVDDLSKMPHLLIAGATGSGKSVCISSIIMSFVYELSPNDLKLLLIDPKMVELMIYNKLPHLITPVISNAKKAAKALKWMVKQMEGRYRKFASLGVRSIDAYNKKIEDPEIRNIDGLDIDPVKMEYIVIIIDELADLMMIAPQDCEDSIARLAQMARAVGIHLIIATQRPSVDVITGVIKANFPARIAFQVASKVDSRTILDANGADKLLGKGDMLFLPPGSPKPTRAQASYLSTPELQKVVDFIEKQYEDYESRSAALFEQELENTQYTSTSDEDEAELDELYEEAKNLVIDARQASASYLQRRFKIGYNRAARMIELMEKEGIVGPADGAKPREIYVPKREIQEGDAV